MPLIIKCEKCYTVLYEGKELKSPYEVLELYEGRCPECGRKLFFDPINVEVKKVKQSVSV
ncbi:MAG: hypothetical protein NWE90_06105 [Candidatus Bathyarchaeota archaeon]|nr:hypothetical protein [Candidatus Bathyarchaeota archaeon]